MFEIDCPPSRPRSRKWARGILKKRLKRSALIPFALAAVLATTASSVMSQEPSQNMEDAVPALQLPSAADLLPLPDEPGGEEPIVPDMPGAENAEAPANVKGNELAETVESDHADAAETEPVVEADAAERELPEEPAEPPPADPEPLPELSKEMAAFGDSIRRTLGRYYQQPVSTSDNTVNDVIHFCLAFGCQAEIRHGNSRINGVGCLCWNYSCAGYHPLRAGSQGIVPAIGYGFQTHPAQLLAMLGRASVPETYELRVGQRRGTIADLVEHEKRACRSGTDQSLRLIGLAYYIRDDQTWRNGLGEEWSLERLLQEELDRTVAVDDRGVADRLMGVSFALQRRRKAGRPLDGDDQRAERFLNEFYRRALSSQNSDGSWHAEFFARRGTSRDTVGSLRSTGRILEWLAYWLPDDQLQTDEVLRAVAYVNSALARQLPRWKVVSASPQEMATTAHALAALMTYDRRVFRPYDRREALAEADEIRR